MAEQSLDRRPPAGFEAQQVGQRPAVQRRHVFGAAALPTHPRATLTFAQPMQRWIFRGGAEAARQCGAAFGLDLPQTACHASNSQGRAALWLGPDEWLLLCSPDIKFGGSEVTPAHSLVDVSHRQLGIETSGPAAATLLNTHVGLDLDSPFGPAPDAQNTCTRTLFAKAEIVLWRKAQGEYHMEVSRSFAGYVVGLLAEAARDCLPIQ